MGITFRKKVLLPPSGEYKKEGIIFLHKFFTYLPNCTAPRLRKKQIDAKRWYPCTRNCTSDDNNIHCIVLLNIKVPIKFRCILMKVLFYCRMISFNPLKPNDLKKTSYRTAKLQTLHFIYLFNKYTY